jgi:Raf kinase inhibitor-like YbhB/YbcL family protein
MRFASSAMPAQTVPARFTCDGADVSPPLEISGVPASARALAISVVDIDAPGGSFAHWLLYGLPTSLRTVGEGKVPSGAKQGLNSTGKRAYKGPCPPEGSGSHQYVFTLYALRTDEGLTDPGLSFDKFRSTVNDRTIGSTSFTKTYKRG